MSLFNYQAPPGNARPETSTKLFHHLQLSIKKKLEEFMATLGRNLTPAQRETIETTGTIVARDNVELACAFIQKKAVEKALPEIDKRLKVTPVFT